MPKCTTQVLPSHVEPSLGSDLGPLVTNTESKPTCEPILRLQAPSLLNFMQYSGRSKRYVLQSVIKEILGACSKDEVGKYSSKFRRFGACKQLSASFRPDDFTGNSKGEIYDIYRSHQGLINENVSKAAISYRKVDDQIQAHFSGMCSCSSVWICPVCSPVVSEYRSKEIAQAMHKHQSEGGFLLFVTFTVRHKRKHDIRDTLKCVSSSVSKTKNSNSWGLFKERVGFCGSIRAPEYTYTYNNGHHPHIHELWFMDKKPNIKEIKDWLYKRYSRFVVKNEGFEAPSYARGIDIRLCLSSAQARDKDNFDEIGSIASYLSKGADTDKTLADALVNRDWGVPEELTKNQFKTVKRTDFGQVINSYNSTAMAIEYMVAQSQYLEAIKKGNDDAANLFRKRASAFKSLYVDYAYAFFGKRQLYWSPGLKDRFGIYEMDDDLVIQNFEGELYELMVLSINQLQKIIKFRLRPQILDIVENPKFKDDKQRVQAVIDYLDCYKTDKDRINRYG